MENKRFNLTVDGIPYEIRVRPYDFNGETRFFVSYNGSEDYAFVWDEDLKRPAAIGDNTADIPESLEEAIALKLLQQV
jgi:hypothetical protein